MNYIIDKKEYNKIYYEKEKDDHYRYKFNKKIYTFPILCRFS